MYLKPKDRERLKDLQNHKKKLTDEEKHECEEEFETESLLSEHDEENDKTEIEEEKSFCANEENQALKEEFETDSLVSDDENNDEKFQ